MSKQTAVEWLLQKIEEKNGTEFSSYYTEFIEQAKAMEKEQIVDAYVEGCENTYGIDEPAGLYSDAECGEDYYNETYGGDNATTTTN